MSKKQTPAPKPAESSTPGLGEEAPARKSRIGLPAPWVPGHYPKKWADFTDAELNRLKLTRPEGDEFKSSRPEPADED